VIGLIASDQNRTVGLQAKREPPSDLISVGRRTVHRVVSISSRSASSAARARILRSFASLPS